MPTTADVITWLTIIWSIALLLLPFAIWRIRRESINHTKLLKDIKKSLQDRPLDPVEIEAQPVRSLSSPSLSAGR